MLGAIGAYVIAFVVLAGIELPFFPITMTLAKLLRRAKWLAPFMIGLLDSIKICCAVLFASWLIHIIGQSPSWLMFLIPGYLIVQNNLSRIKRVRAGMSNVGQMLKQGGEPQSYDRRQDLWIESGHLIGDILGWIVGTNLILQTASFF